MNLFCLPEWSIQIGHYGTTDLQYFKYNLAKPHVNKQVFFGFESNSFEEHIYWYHNVNIPIKTIWTNLPNSDWKLINSRSGQKYCTLIGWLDASFNNAWADFSAP